MRRLWKDVTISLKEDDVESATAAKHKVCFYLFVNGGRRSSLTNGPDRMVWARAVSGVSALFSYSDDASPPYPSV